MRSDPEHLLDWESFVSCARCLNAVAPIFSSYCSTFRWSSSGAIALLLVFDSVSCYGLCPALILSPGRKDPA